MYILLTACVCVYSTEHWADIESMLRSCLPGGALADEWEKFKACSPTSWKEVKRVMVPSPRQKYPDRNFDLTDI